MPRSFARARVLLATGTVAALGAGLLLVSPSTASADPAEPIRIDTIQEAWHDHDLVGGPVTSPVRSNAVAMVQAFTAQRSGVLDTVRLRGQFTNRTSTVTITDATGYVAPVGKTEPVFGVVIGTHTQTFQQGSHPVLTAEFEAAGRLVAGRQYVLAYQENANGSLDLWSGDSAAAEAAGGTPGASDLRIYSTYMGTGFQVHGNSRLKLDVDVVPSISATVTPNGALDDDGWHAVAPSIDVTCDSGVTAGCPDLATAPDSGDALTGTATVDGQPYAWTLPLKLDTTGPVVTGQITTAVGTGGVYDSDITVAWSCTDALSTVPVCPAPTVVSGQGTDTVATVTVPDDRGNATTASVSGLVRRAALAEPEEQQVRPAITAHQVKVTGLPKKKVQGKPSVKAGKKLVLKLRIRTATGAVVKAKPSVRHDKHAAPKVRKVGKKGKGRWAVTVKLPKRDRATFQTIAVVTSNGTVKNIELHVR